MVCLLRFYHSAFPLFSGCFSYEYWKYYTMSFSGIECLSLKKLCKANACRVTNFLSNKSFGLCYLPCTQEKLKQSPLSGVYMLEVLLTASSIKAMKRNDVWAIENASKAERNLFKALSVSIGAELNRADFGLPT